MVSWLYTLKTHSCQRIRGTSYITNTGTLNSCTVSSSPSFPSSSTMPAFVRSLVNNTRTRHEHLMIFSSYMSFVLDEVGNVLVAEAKEDVQKGLSYEFLQTMINQVYAEFHYEFVREIANFNHNLEI